MNSTTLIVPEGTHRERADKVLAQAYPEHSRVAWQRAFDADLVRLGDRVIKAKQTVSAGDVLTFSLPENRPSELKAVDIPLDVLFEDEHLLALNKESGMIVHPGAGTGEDTLVHALLSHCEGELSGIGGVERPGIVHRLDRETSGVLLVAKTDAAHRGLSEQFAERTLTKEYLALVEGVPQLLSGSIRKAIGRNPTQRHKMAVVESGGKEAHTDWQVEERFAPFATLVRCLIHTGRTHQIRVHLKSLGHTIVGDVVYGWKPEPKWKNPPERVMLHAEHLRVVHPITGKVLDLRAPLPKDFRTQLNYLRKIAEAVPTPKAPAKPKTEAHVREKH